MLAGASLFVKPSSTTKPHSGLSKLRAGFSCGPLVAGRVFPLWTLKSFSSKWKILLLLYEEVSNLRVARLALALNAQAKDKEKYNGPVVSVSDNGSTVLLVGTAVLVLGLASRRMAIR